MISNKLTLNLSKSNLMIIPPRKLLPEKCTSSLDFSQITLCKTVKYLGITIDDSLNFDAHTKFLENKLARSLSILFKTRQYLNTSTLVQLYYLTFHAYLSYGLIIWGSEFKSYLNKLSSLQNKAVRIRDVEAVYLQTASVSTPIASSASASKQIHRNFATKIRSVRS